MADSFRGCITHGADMGDIHTSFSKESTHRNALMTTLPKEALNPWKAWNFPNSHSTKRLNLWLAFLRISYTISIFKTEFSAGRGAPRKSIFSQHGIGNQSGFYFHNIQVEFDVYAFSFSPETNIASLHNNKTNNTKPSHLKPNWIKKKN